MNLPPFWALALGILLFLTTATSISWTLAWRVGRENPTISNLLQRINAWWWLVGIGVPVLAMGEHAAILLFAGLSFLALREFLSLTPTQPGDRPVLFTAFFIAIPLQYLLVATGWYGLFAILVPVYGFFLFSALATLGQDTANFLERTAKIQWAVMVCVYGISHAPALLFLPLKGIADNAVLLLFFLLVVQISDVLQYVSGKLFGRHKVAPVLSPNKTVEGLVGGGMLAALLGGLLHGFTPFSFWQAIAMALVVVVAGFFGGLVLSAVKRSLGTKDWGESIPGHGGILDRLDSIAFAAPLFFHLTRYWFAA
jgi:phosphatidate cytidylyltransferase